MASDDFNDRVLLSEFRNYSELATRHGLDIPVTEEDFQKLSFHEKRKVIRSLREAVRSPDS
jgi:hypothetical protein